MMSSFAAPAFAALLKSTALFGAALLILRAMRRSSAAARHAVCLLALAGSVPLLLFSFLPSPIHVLPAGLSVFSTASTATRAAASSPVDWTAICLALWAGGMLAFTVRYLSGILLVRRIVTNAGVVSDHAWLRDLDSAASNLDVPAGSVSLRFADLASPVTCGLLRPSILVPPAARHWSAEQRHAVLMHELAHVRRRDLWTNAAAAISTFVFWFHPLAWMLAARLREEQECACDDVVLNGGFVPTAYADVLLAAARTKSPGALFACAMNGGVFRNRVAHVLDAARCRTADQAISSRAVLAGLACVAVLSLLGPAIAAAEEVHKIGGDVQAPTLTHKVEPKYTDAARDAKIEGTVVLGVVIGSNGRITESQIKKGLDAGLDQNALAAVQEWVFEPATRKGEPVAVQATIEVNFRLQ